MRAELDNKGETFTHIQENAKHPFKFKMSLDIIRLNNYIYNSFK